MIPILSSINEMPRINIHSNIVFPSKSSLPESPVDLPVKIFKALLPSSILVTYPAHLNLLDFITLTILSERYKL